MSRVIRSLGALCALALAASCDNAGADRSLGITASGTVRGFVYFDANGSRVFDAGDTPFAGARVRLVGPVTRDTLVRATTGADGTFLVPGVPVGSYALILDDASVGDTAQVVGLDLAALVLLPGDTASVEGAVSFPLHAAAAVRTLPLGTRLFVTGVALHARGTFSDTLLHMVDTSGAIRAARVRPSPVAAGDSVRMRGVVAERDGERLLDDVSVFVLGPTFVPTLTTVTTAEAAAALAGSLDAALVRVPDATVSDTATVDGNLTRTVTDGSGALTVVLDRAADGSFRAPFPAGLYVPARQFDIIGVLVPTGAGTWRLRPRSALDLTLR
jgi:hypothetical protein